jgi:glycosyltransferase involved in cell wall biosynthesis
MISIITITYNNFDELIKTINSIPNSSLIESIVINGGDCQRTKKFLEDYSGKSISEKDEGISDAFNKGIKISTGSYIMFLNSGDILIDNRYPENAYRILEENNDIGFVHANLILNDKSGISFLMKPTFSNLGRGMPYLHPTMVVRKDIFNLIGLFNISIKIAMDFEWIVRLELNNVNGFYFDGSPVVQMDGQGKSILDERNSIRECYGILKKYKLTTIANIFGFSRRYLLFELRNLLPLLGFNRLLIWLKKKKYSV